MFNQKMVEVGKATVIIIYDNRTFMREFYGFADCSSHWNSEFILNVKQVIADWQNDNKNRGEVEIDTGFYVPSSDITSIEIQYESYQVKIKDIDKRKR
jgi:hypothetical protein